MIITELPKELQYFILAKLDGLALARARCVCRAWKEIVGHLEGSFNIWVRCCLKEIPSSILVQLTGMCRFVEQGEISAEVCSRVGWQFWRDLYYEFQRSRVVGVWEHMAMEITIPFMFCKATSISLGEDFLVSGHHVSGQVLLWQNLGATDALTVSTVHKHHQYVSCVQIINPERNWKDLGRTDIKQSCPCIVSSSRDCIVNVSSLLGGNTHHIAHFSKQVNDLSVCGEYFVAGAKSAVLHGQPIWRVISSEPLMLEQTHQLWGQRMSNVTAVAMTFGTVVSGDSCGNLMMWDSEAESLADQEPEIIHKFTHSVKQICLQGDRLVCLLDDGSICARREQDFTCWPPDKLFHKYEGTPKCIALKATVLAVATSFGGVHIYNLPDNTSWLNLNIENPTCSINTGKNTITAISIGKDERSPVVALAADDETITLIRWRPSCEKHISV